jgi:hypothetical protein
MKTITLHIDDSFGERFRGDYVFRGIAYGLYCDILDRNVERHPLTGQVTKQNTRKINAEIALASLVSQPEGKPLSIATLNAEYIEEGGVPVSLASKLIECASKVSMITSEEKNKLTLSVIRQKPTPEAFRAWMCIELGCLPSELKEESAKDILEIVAYIEATVKNQPQPKDPEQMLKEAKA